MAQKRREHHIGVEPRGGQVIARHKAYFLRRPCFAATVMIKPTLIRDE
jgi:hypothetical protein